ncbi:NfeD family protein [Sphingomonas glacialis]|uniref:NfeD family protein n=1 Tax=Sphingomonas glacialis TaxID=658225 RepID=A0A502FY35_9SPHN|nr:NfeD family protein [Sphingomonas glacialis]TPG53966.1 NfeD family protein [Sphingomonas glacialis]
MVFGIDWSLGALWLAAALGLVIAEMLVPGFFLVFLGVGAAVTGLLVLIVPGVPVVLQALVFAGMTAGAVAIGWRWYRGLATTAAEPALNDRAARLIGRRVLVCEAIVDGEGRVTVGDGAWSAMGPDAAVGASVRIVGADGSVLRVELG